MSNEPTVFLPMSIANSCLRCGENFGILSKKYHCNMCGLVVCSKCLNHRYVLQGKAVRACKVCHNSIVNKVKQ